VIRGSLLFSALLNIGHGWEYQAVEYTLGFSRFTSFYENAYSRINGHSYSDYPETNQGTPYFIYSMVYFSINFGAFFILNTGLEVNMVRHLQKELRKKRERLAKIKLNISGVKTCLDEAKNKNKPQKALEDEIREKADGEKERTLIKMIVLNCILSLILRGPDLLYCMENVGVNHNIFTLSDYEDISRYAIVPGLLSFLTDLAYFTYLMTFTTSFIIFYKFNKKFNEKVVFFWTQTEKNRVIINSFI
jgi:hypothetical protein